jgi:Outer membrane protein beta-barrel domain
MKQLYIFLFLILSPSLFHAQGYGFGVKGGLAIGNQRFDGSGTFDNSLLFKYQGDVFIESAPEDPTSVMYASLGYHVRGHARRYRASAYDNGGQIVRTPSFTQNYAFNNISLGVGFKRRNVLNREHAYYGIGMRGEYTLNTNLESANSLGFYSIYNLTEDFVKKFNFGMTLTGGYEFPFSDLAGAFVEFSVHPDITKQYYQPFYNPNTRDPFTGQPITGVSEQSSRNLTMEITIGFRFLRKIIYTD